MTVRLIANIATFVGLSVDKKPTDVPPGSRFFETDTQLGFIFDGTVYVAEKIDPAVGTNILLSAILMALNVNNAHLAQITGEDLEALDIEEVA